MKAKLTPAVRALANGAANDKDSVPIMTGVLITEREAICSDGYIIVIKQLPSPEMDLGGDKVDDGIHEIVVPADAIRALKGEDVQLSCMEVQRESPSSLEAITDKYRKVARLDGPDFSVEAPAIEGEYPKYLKMFSPSPLVAQVAFNTKNLKKMLKTLPDDSIIQLRISEPSKPVELQCTDPDGGIPIRGLIGAMPVMWDNVTWLTTTVTPGNVIEKAMAKLAEDATNEKPKDDETVVTITSGDKTVITTDKKIAEVADKLGKKCPICGSEAHGNGWHNLTQNKGK